MRLASGTVRLNIKFDVTRMILLRTGLQRAANLFAPGFSGCAVDGGLNVGEFPIAALKDFVIIVFNTVYAHGLVIKLVGR